VTTPTSPKLRTLPPMPSKRPIALVTFDYGSFVAELKTRITSARLTASRAVSSELVSLYWDIGAAIRQKQTTQGWGDAVVERLSQDLKKSFPGTTGFSTINLWRMRQLHETYTGADFLSQPVREIGTRVMRREGPSRVTPAKLAQAVREMVVAIP
jgi:hypothetical protein